MKKLLIYLCTVAVILTCTACGANPYTFTNEPFVPMDWEVFELDEGFSIDGEFTETEWATAPGFEYAGGDADPKTSLNVTYRYIFTDLGLYFAIEVEDFVVSNNPELFIYQNDSIEFYIDPFLRDASISSGFIQLRISALNDTETWIGVKTSSYEWTRLYIPFAHATKIHGELNPAYYNGVYSEGYDIEMFIPWYAMHHDERPDRIGVFPAIVNSFGTTVKDYLWIPHKGIHTNVNDYVCLSADGVTEIPSIQGDIFGTHADGIKATRGWDLSNETTQVVQTGARDQRLFYNAVNSQKYIFSTQVKLGKPLDGDPYPKVGIIVGENTEREILFFLDPLPAHTQKKACFASRYGDNGAWTWGEAIDLPASINYNDFITLTVIRNDNSAIALVNGVKAGEFNDLNLNGDSMTGFFTMAHTATYKNWSSETNVSAVDAEWARHAG